MNKVILMGRLCQDADVRYINEKAIATFTLAVDRKYKKEGQPTTDYIRCVDWYKPEWYQIYGKQGVKFVIEGRLQTGSYTDKDGKKVYTTDVIVENKEFAESKKTQATQETAKEWQNVDDLDDAGLPFN